VKAILFIGLLILFTFCVNAQNGTYICKHQEYRALNPAENKVSHKKYKITIQIYGIGGNDFVSAELQTENPKQKITYKWKINSELRMAPGAKGKRIFNSYTANLISDEKVINNDYQITIIKRTKRGKTSVAAINNDGETIWFYDLQKIK
jgi:hypothetical protein